MLTDLSNRRSKSKVRFFFPISAFEMARLNGYFESINPGYADYRAASIPVPVSYYIPSSAGIMNVSKVYVKRGIIQPTLSKQINAVGLWDVLQPYPTREQNPPF